MPRTVVVAVVCGAAVLTALAVLVARGGHPVTPVADTAVIESYTLYASRAQLLVGPYSRYGWHHPGPLFFYLLTPIYALSGSTTSGLNAGALLINLASIGVVLWVVARWAGGWLTIALAGAMTAFVWRVAPVLVSPWNPHVVVLPVIALAVVAAAAASGAVALLPLGAGLASFVMQTHIGVVPDAIAMSAVLASAVWVATRDESGRRLRALVAAAAVVATLWAVPLAEQMSATPGNMTALWRFFGSQGRGHQTLAASYAAWSDMVTGVARPDFRVGEGSPFRRSRWRPARSVAAVESAALLVVSLNAFRKRRRFEASFAAVVLLALGVAFGAITRIHDVIVDHEVFWISGLGALAAAAIAAAAAAAVTRSDAPRRLVVPTVVLAGVVAAAIGFGELRSVVRRTFAPDPARRAAAILGDALDRRVRAVGARPLIRIDQNEWAVAAGAVLHLQRGRLPYAVEDDWLPMFTEHARATGGETVVIAITGRERELLLTSSGAGETIAAADPFYAVAIASGR